MRGIFDFDAKFITAWCVNKHCTHEQKCAAFNKEHAGTVHVIKMLQGTVCIKACALLFSVVFRLCCCYVVDCACPVDSF